MVTLLVTLAVMTGSASAMVDGFVQGRQQALTASAAVNLHCPDVGITPAMRHFAEAKPSRLKGRKW